MEGKFTISSENIEALAGQRAAEQLLKHSKFWTAVECGVINHIKNLASKTLYEYEGKIKTWTQDETKTHKERFKKKLQDTIDGNLREAKEEAKKQIRNEISNRWATWRHRITDKWFEEVAKEVLAIHMRKSFGRTANQIAKDLLSTYEEKIKLLLEKDDVDYGEFKAELYKASNAAAHLGSSEVLGKHMDRLQLLLRERLEEEAEREFGKREEAVA